MGERLRRGLVVVAVAVASLALARAAVVSTRFDALDVGPLTTWSFREYRNAETASGHAPGVAGGKLLHRWIEYECISQHLAAAVVASEDTTFLRHSGFVWRELGLALSESWKKRRLVRGASSISQQLVKNLFLTPERSLARKAHEAWLTLELEARLDKRRILELYLNVVEWGPDIYGVEAASRHYFDTSSARLGRSQAAFLASLLPSPLRGVRPHDGDSRTELRMHRTLSRMDGVRIPEPGVAEVLCPDGPPRERPSPAVARSFSPRRQQLQRQYPSLRSYPRLAPALMWGLEHHHHQEILRGLGQTLSGPVKRWLEAPGRGSTTCPLDSGLGQGAIEELSPGGAILEAVRLLIDPTLSAQRIFAIDDVVPVEQSGSGAEEFARFMRQIVGEHGDWRVDLSPGQNFRGLLASVNPLLCVVSHRLDAPRAVRVHHHAMILYASQRHDALFKLDASPVSGLGFSRMRPKRLLRYAGEYIRNRHAESLERGSGQLTCADLVELAASPAFRAASTSPLGSEHGR